MKMFKSKKENVCILPSSRHIIGEVIKTNMQMIDCLDEIYKGPDKRWSNAVNEIREGLIKLSEIDGFYENINVNSVGQIVEIRNKEINNACEKILTNQLGELLSDEGLDISVEYDDHNIYDSELGKIYEWLMLNKRDIGQGTKDIIFGVFGFKKGDDGYDFAKRKVFSYMSRGNEKGIFERVSRGRYIAVENAM